ncbi:MAG: NUDIX hydrolase [uncultured bacterium (gcode 4)]|uniref:NUDIX hydrolase n=1 Tax=uncultured bacterium (gcode 4) TaxID=1234023 RepID=K2GSD6_9BACT|nr:MAG: NUDIX hydrolase [uncultured bacterium (gcode 4)]
MHRKKLQQLLSSYEIVLKEDKQILKNFKSFIDNEKKCFSRSLKAGHITGSAWIVDKSRSYGLFAHHRKLNKWLQLGGHADDDIDVFAVALKEAKEESGLKNITALSDQIFDIDIHSVWEKDSCHYHYDVRFIFQADLLDKLIVSHESNDLAWISFNDLNKFISEYSVLKMYDKMKILNY